MRRCWGAAAGVLGVNSPGTVRYVALLRTPEMMPLLSGFRCFRPLWKKKRGECVKEGCGMKMMGVRVMNTNDWRPLMGSPQAWVSAWTVTFWASHGTCTVDPLCLTVTPVSTNHTRVVT